MVVHQCIYRGSRLILCAHRYGRQELLGLKLLASAWITLDGRMGMI